MTVINPYTLSVDGVVLNTYASNIEEIRGLRVLGGKRRQVVYAANRHGSVPSGHIYSEEKRLPLLISMMPFDEDGVFDHPSGRVGHLQENLDVLQDIFGKSGPIDVRQKIPTRVGSGDVEVLVECQASALVDKVSMADGNAGGWSMVVELVLEYPYWHELPVISEAVGTHLIEGTAPVADMVFTFSGDGEVEWADGGSLLEIDGSTGAVVVDVGKKRVTQAGLPARGLLKLGAGTPAHWMEWPAQTVINLTSTGGVNVSYYNARH